jgi:capsular exopolysaccharide synthesis family protein
MNNHDNYGVYDKPEKEEINLWDYWAVILKRKWTIITFAFTMLAMVTLFSFIIRPTYNAKGILLIEKEPNILTFEEIFKIESYMDDYYQTQFKLLRSESLAENVIERLKLYEDEKFVGKLSTKEKSVDESDSAFRSRLVAKLLGRLNVKPIRQTRLVEVHFKDRDPKFAANVVNALFDSFIDMNIELRYETTEQATEFLTNQITSLRSEIEGKERELQQYGAEKNIIALSDTETTIIEKLGELNRALTEAQIERVRKEAYYNEIRIASPDYLPEALTNPLIQRLRENYVNLSNEFMKKQETFRSEYPEMQRLKAELDSAKVLLERETNNLIKGAFSEYQAALKKERSLEAVFNRQKEEAIQLNSDAILFNSLKIEIENKKNMHESLIKRQSETGVAARLRGLKTSNVRVVDRAKAPLYPSSPRKKLNMLLALLIGLFGGTGLAFFLEHLDNSVKNFEDVEKYTGLPTLGVVPTFSVDGFKRGYGSGYKRRSKIKIAVSGERRKAGEETRKGEKEDQDIDSIELITYRSPKSNFSENYFSIRTSLLLSSADPNLKSIGISSPLPMEGKTATVSNLAVALALANKKVLIVDSDFRKPKQHRIFKIKDICGLTNYLTANVELKDLIKPTQVPNLFLINAGPIPPKPMELLASEKMANLIGILKQLFDYVLYDTPPILPLSDATELGSKLDGMILVIWGEKTSREALKQAKEKLDLLKIKTLGVVINNINIRKHDYYRSYYHYYDETRDKQ